MLEFFSKYIQNVFSPKRDRSASAQLPVESSAPEPKTAEAQRSSKVGLEDLPPELLTRVATHLDAPAFMSLSQTSRNMRALTQDVRYLAKEAGHAKAREVTGDLYDTIVPEHLPDMYRGDVYSGQNQGEMFAAAEITEVVGPAGKHLDDGRQSDFTKKIDKLSPGVRVDTISELAPDLRNFNDQSRLKLSEHLIQQLDSDDEAIAWDAASAIAVAEADGVLTEKQSSRVSELSDKNADVKYNLDQQRKIVQQQRARVGGNLGPAIAALNDDQLDWDARSAAADAIVSGTEFLQGESRPGQEEHVPQQRAVYPLPGEQEKDARRALEFAKTIKDPSKRLAMLTRVGPIIDAEASSPERQLANLRSRQDRWEERGLDTRSRGADRGR